MNKKNYQGTLRKDIAGEDDPFAGSWPEDCCCSDPLSGKPEEPKTTTPKKYTDLTDEDLSYIEAVRCGDEDTYSRMIRRAFFRAFPNTVVRDEVWRRDADAKFTKFNIRRKNKSDAGWLGEGVYFYGSYEEAKKRYDYGWNLRPFYVNIERMFEIGKPTHDAIARANAAGVSHEVTQITKDFDGIFYNGDMCEEWCVRDPRNVKIAQATYDDWGQIIPLSYRFDRTNPDFRF